MRGIPFAVLLCFTAVIPERSRAADFVCVTPTSASSASRASTHHRGRSDLKQLEPVQPDDLSRPPYKYIGQLRFDMGGESYVGSAVFIGTNLLLTAAHNVKDTDGEASALTFVRAMKADGTGAKTFQISRIVYLSKWLTMYDKQDSFEYASLDYAILRTTEASDVGNLNIYTGQPLGPGSQLPITSYSDIPDGGLGEQMFSQDSTIKEMKDGAYSAKPDGFARGASGGPWLADRDKVLSTVSWGKIEPSDPDLIYGPALGQTAQDMIAFAEDECR